MTKVDPFRRSVDSGLYVPPDLSRVRQVWTKQEWKLLERCTIMLNLHDVDLHLQCRHKSCKAAPLEGSRQLDGSFQLQCAHADRVMTKAF